MNDDQQNPPDLDLNDLQTPQNMPSSNNVPDAQDLPDSPTQDDGDGYFEEDHEREMFHPGQEPHLAEDGASPAAPATDVPGAGIPIDHPQTDSNLEAEEVYEQGAGNASNVNTMHEEHNIADDIAAEPGDDVTGRAR